MNMGGKYVAQERRRALIGNMHKLDRRYFLEKLAVEMGRCAGAIRTIAVLAGVRFAEGDEVSQRAYAGRSRDNQKIGLERTLRDRHKILEHVVRQLDAHGRRLN